METLRSKSCSRNCENSTRKSLEPRQGLGESCGPDIPGCHSGSTQGYWLWWKGPGWLTDPHHSTRDKNSEEKMTENVVSYAKDEARKKSSIYSLSTQSSLNETIDKLVKDCFALTKIKRSLAYCLRLGSNCRKPKEERIFFKLALPELDLARCEIIKYSQRNSFQDDLKNLQDKRKLNHANRLQYRLQ